MIELKQTDKGILYLLSEGERKHEDYPYLVIETDEDGNEKKLHFSSEQMSAWLEGSAY